MSSLPTDSQERKDAAVFTAFLAYFPLAVMEVARLSVAANEKHNPGEPVHWAKEKSNDHLDCLVRHALETGIEDTDLTVGGPCALGVWGELRHHSQAYHVRVGGNDGNNGSETFPFATIERALI